MAKRKATAQAQPEGNMEANEPLDQAGDPNDQPGDPQNPDQGEQPGDQPGQPEGDPPPEQGQVQAAPELDALEAQLKAQLADVRKQKKDKGIKPAKTPKVAKEKVPRPPKDEANGVTRPMMGVTKDVWDTADMLSKRLGTYVDRATLTEVLNGKVEIGTIHTQYGRWRKYYGLTETREQRSARMDQIKAKKLADLGLAPGQPQAAAAQGEQQEAATQ